MAENKNSQTLTSTFNALLKQARKDFPEQLKGKTLLFLVYDKEQESFEFIGTKKDIIGSDIESWKKWIDGALYNNPIYGKSNNDNKKTSILAFATYTDFPENKNPLLTYVVPDANPRPAMRSMILTHELGHLLTPDLYDSNETYNKLMFFGEYAAQAFVALYKPDVHAETEESVRFNRANGLIVNGTKAHFYLPVLQGLETLPGNTVLSPQETMNAACRAAIFYASPMRDIEALIEVFEPARKKFSKLDGAFGMAPFEDIARIMFEDHGHLSSLAFMTGKAFLTPFLNGHPEEALADYPDIYKWPPETVTKLKEAFQDEKWDSVRQKIKEHDERMAPHTPTQHIRQEAKDLMLLGRFDKEPGEVVHPLAYSSKENMAYLRRAMKAYGDLRLKNPSVDREEAIKCARQVASKPPAQTPYFKSTP